MIYKTLFQKLDSDVLIKMYNEQSEYPNLIGGILKQLNQLIDVEDLRISSATMKTLIRREILLVYLAF